MGSPYKFTAFNCRRYYKKVNGLGVKFFCFHDTMRIICCVVLVWQIVSSGGLQFDNNGKFSNPSVVNKDINTGTKYQTSSTAHEKSTEHQQFLNHRQSLAHQQFTKHKHSSKPADKPTTFISDSQDSNHEYGGSGLYIPDHLRGLLTSKTRSRVPTPKSSSNSKRISYGTTTNSYTKGGGLRFGVGKAGVGFSKSFSSGAQYSF